MDSLTNKEFTDQLDNLGIKSKVIPICHLKEIEEDISKIQIKHTDIQTNIHKYLSGFEFEKANTWERAKSIIVVAVPQKVGRIVVTYHNKDHIVLIPPMYLLDASPKTEYRNKGVSGITKTLEGILEEQNYHLKRCNLPCKPLAVRSGMGKYGLNNLCYIKDIGSLYWFGAYLSDMPCDTDTWGDYSNMSRCNTCRKCQENCPTNAIGNDRYSIHANRCLTLHNENAGSFPIWIAPNWHNALIGCLRCQFVCPENREYIKNSAILVKLNEQETQAIMNDTPIEQLHDEIICKLEQFNFIESYPLLSRNLKVLLKGK